MHISHRRPCRPALAADRSGNIAIEFALCLPILLLLTVGLLDLGRYSLQKSAMLQGARAGAQYGILDYSAGAEAKVNTTAQEASGLSGVTASTGWFCECASGTAVSCDAAVTCSGSVMKKRYVTVSLSKTFDSVLTTPANFGVFGSWTPPTSLSASVTMMVVVP
jgi:Flp pilus assembly protein TadG